MKPTATSRDLRHRNRAALLRKIVLDGETTRPELAAACGLSPATVTNVVSDLMRDGLVQETGLRPSEGGRPMARLGAVPEGAYVIGVDVGENGVTAELFDLRLNRVGRVYREVATRTASPERVTSALSDAVSVLRSAHPGLGASLAGIGLGVPGIVDTTADGPAKIYTQSLGWGEIVVDQLFRLDGVPVYADNGAKTLAAAESWFGAARGAGHAVVALVGRGIGAGVIVDGRILRGFASSAGEWGHTKVAVDGPQCHCGGRGCLEAFVGGEAILRRWAGRPENQGSPQHGSTQPREADETRLALVLRAAAAGDRVARELVSETIEILGLGLANLVNLFNPERIVVGGWVGLLLVQAHRAELEQAVRRHALRRPGEQFRLEACVFGDDAVALGAALLPLDRLIEGDIPAPKARPPRQLRSAQPFSLVTAPRPGGRARAGGRERRDPAPPVGLQLLPTRRFLAAGGALWRSFPLWLSHRPASRSTGRRCRKGRRSAYGRGEPVAVRSGLSRPAVGRLPRACEARAVAGAGPGGRRGGPADVRYGPGKTVPPLCSQAKGEGSGRGKIMAVTSRIGYLARRVW